MQIKVFHIPVPGGEQMNDELNAFLRSKKLLQTESHFVSNAQGTFWCFCVKYLDEATCQRHALPLVAFTRHADALTFRKKILLTTCKDENYATS